MGATNKNIDIDKIFKSLSPDQKAKLGGRLIGSARSRRKAAAARRNGKLGGHPKKK
jgi:hypothetical protein